MPIVIKFEFVVCTVGENSFRLENPKHTVLFYFHPQCKIMLVVIVRIRLIHVGHND